MVPNNRLSELNRWLLSEGRRMPDMAHLLEALVARLIEVGLQIERATIGAPLSHPIARSSFSVWSPEEGAEQSEVVWNATGMERLVNSPMYPIHTEGRDVDWRLGRTPVAGEYGIGPDLRQKGFTHYIGLALPFSDGSFKGCTFQTRRTEGFSEAELDLLRSLVPALSSTVEIFVQKAFANTLMETFVGPRAGKRVLDGQIHRGDGEMIRAVVWMSDIRGFTKLAAEREAGKVIDLLNLCFETVTGAISDEGGEVLKFIGDAVLGIFPVDGNAAKAVSQAEAAYDRLKAALACDDWPRDLRVGAALHLGEVFYGNIGGQTRLDFTVIGPAVNLVSRVEGLCSELELPFLVTDDIARLSDRRYAERGRHRLKGVKEPVTVLTPDDSHDAGAA
jgi:adenylate cyclase